MRNSSVRLLPVLVLNLYLAATLLVQGSDDAERKPYIVYMGQLPEEENTILHDAHHSLLASVIKDEDIARDSRIHSYRRSFNGFAARLLPHEADALSEMDGVVSVFPNTRKKLHTTRSWDFIGMIESVKRKPEVESNLIIGVLDTGICVNSPSFNDKGYGPIPSKWKGRCDTGANFTGCNRKVIGARCYNLASSGKQAAGGSGVHGINPTPADTEGHGTHTASTAAGVAVPGASLYGLGAGTARGGVPSARIAMYKVCTDSGCTDMDIMAAFDDAIADGVDLISISIGGPAGDFFRDPIALGAFHAMKRGILTTSSGGNDGPVESSVENVAPWMMTVAASSMDRQFRTFIKLGNGQKATGISLNTFQPRKQMYSLVNGVSPGRPSACDGGVSNDKRVKGHILYCVGLNNQDTTVKQLGGAGIITTTDPTSDAAFSISVPGAYLNITEGKKLEDYMNSTARKAKALIHKTIAVHQIAPFVASFSSRGPQQVTRNILKPDLAAPGLNILAAYSTLTSITGNPDDNRISKFNIISGTSMACPHAAAAAAYVKTFRPSWSPAAIKSALMTTATPMRIREPDGELGSGSGQINPTKALHPGLVYDISISSYISFLCKQGYNDTAIGLITGKKQFRCSNFKPAPGDDGLNYPSFHIFLKEGSTSISAIFYREVTNVGFNKSVYTAKVTTPEGLLVTVVPSMLSFDRMHAKKSFKVVLKGKPSESRVSSASLEWSDGSHSVRSPIVIFNPIV